MGWLSNAVNRAVNTIKRNPITAVSSVIGGGPGGMLPAFAYEQSMKKQAPEQTSEDPRITELRSKMVEQAKNFRSNLGTYKAQQFDTAAREGRDALNQNLSTIKKSANQRGLLFSGLRTGAEAGARTNVASMLAKQRAEINRSADDLADSYDNVAASVGLAGYGDSIKRADDQYQSALEAAMARRRAYGQLGEGVGYGLGSLYGARDRTMPQSSGGLISTGQSYRNYSNAA